VAASDARLFVGRVNEQVFPLDGYLAMFAEAGLEAADMACDWGFSLKAALRKPTAR